MNTGSEDKFWSNEGLSNHGSTELTELLPSIRPPDWSVA